MNRDITKIAEAEQERKKKKDLQMEKEEKKRKLESEATLFKISFVQNIGDNKEMRQ